MLILSLENADMSECPHQQNPKMDAKSTKSDDMTDIRIKTFVLGLIYGSALTVSIAGSTSLANWASPSSNHAKKGG